MSDFFPTTGILIGAAALSAARFENQRWVRAQQGVQQGKFDLNFVAILIGFIAMVFGLSFWIAVGYDYGWLTMIGLATTTFVGAVAWSIVSAFISIKILGVRESFGLWLSGTILIIPLVMWLATKVTWFGLIS